MPVQISRGSFFADSAIRNPQIAKEKKSLMDGKSRRMGVLNGDRVASAAIRDLLQENFASVPSASPRHELSERTGGPYGCSQHDIVRLIVRLMGRLVAEISVGFSRFSARVRTARTLRTMRDGCVPLS
jgi:hypothetical protein